MVCESFLKWGTPIAGWFFWWKIALKWMMTGGTPISGSPSAPQPQIRCRKMMKTWIFTQVQWGFTTKIAYFFLFMWIFTFRSFRGGRFQLNTTNLKSWEVVIFIYSVDFSREMPTACRKRWKWSGRPKKSLVTRASWLMKAFLRLTTVATGLRMLLIFSNDTSKYCELYPHFCKAIKQNTFGHSVHFIPF